MENKGSARDMFGYLIATIYIIRLKIVYGWDNVGPLTRLQSLFRDGHPARP